MVSERSYTVPSAAWIFSGAWRRAQGLVADHLDFEVGVVEAVQADNVDAGRGHGLGKRDEPGPVANVDKEDAATDKGELDLHRVRERAIGTTAVGVDEDEGAHIDRAAEPRTDVAA